VPGMRGGVKGGAPGGGRVPGAGGCGMRAGWGGATRPGGLFGEPRIEGEGGIKGEAGGRRKAGADLEVLARGTGGGRRPSAVGTPFGGFIPPGGDRIPFVALNKKGERKEER
jgi:hypothetical protein